MQDDEVGDETSFDPSYATPGPRRSTFTPPPVNNEIPAGDEPLHDDDELANALAADMQRVSPAGVPPAAESVGFEPLAPEPVASEPAEQPAPPVAPPVTDPAPWMSLPAPDPSHAVDLGEGPPQRPTRRSLPDDQLLSWVDEAGREPGGTLNVIEQLESQLRLREDEAREFSAWESTMLSLGTPDAAEAVEQARPEFTGVLPGVPAPRAEAAPVQTESFVDPDAAVADWPLPDFDNYDTAVNPIAEVAQQPAPWEPQPWEPEFVAVAEAPTAPEPEVPVSPPLPAWDIPAPSATWAPGPEYGPEYDTEYDTETATEAATAEVAEASPSPEPIAEPESVPELLFTAEPEPEVEPEAIFAPAVADTEPAAAESAVAESAVRDDAAPDDAAPDDAVPDDAAPDDAAPDDAAFSFADLLAGPAEHDNPAPEPEAVFAAALEPAPVETEVRAQEPVATEPAPAVFSFDDLLAGPPNEAPEHPEAAPLDAQAEPALGPEAVLEPEIEPEPEPEPEQLVAFAPPPLVEPPTLYGPPILPSEAARQAPISSIPDFESPEPTTDTSDTADTEIVEAEIIDDEVVAVEITDDNAPEPEQPAPFAFSVPPLVEPAKQFSFADLLAGGDDESEIGEEPPLHSDPEPATAEQAVPEPLFIEPMPFAAGEAVPTDTGSVTVIDRAYEEELADDVDEVDRVFPAGLLFGPVSVDTSGVALTSQAIPLPSGPISTVKIPEDEYVLLDKEPVRQRVFSLETSGLEPTPTDHRVGRAARLFWLWFAANSSVLSLGLGAAIFAVGMSLRQSIVAVLAGVALSFIPLGLTTLAGKRSGQPTMVVSRATFGLMGNAVPAALALITRVFWGAVLLWLLAFSVAVVLVGAGLNGGLGDRQVLLISLGVAFLIAMLIAFAGYPMFARMQLILSIVSAILVAGLIALTASRINLSVALSTPDGSWILVVTGAVLVFSFVGLVWANSGADLARYQRVGSSGAASMLWATVGSTLPTFLLIAYGALLAASDPAIAEGLMLSPLDTLASLLPSWYPIPLIAAAALSLLSGITLSLYSGGFALQSLGVTLRRQWSTVVVGVLLALIALLLTFGVTGGINELFRDAATTLAVPTAAWAGLFAAETMIRSRRLESQSLLTRGGVYPDVRWGNLIALIVITVVGFGLTSATITWLGWQGYLFTIFGVPLDSELGGTDLGVFVALGLGILFPIIAGVPAIRRQEEARVLPQ